uniref:Uncharacterized protein n=1 Tax=Arion vulgaris TaxID=1028688 RepID=A0A0B6ZHD9_9EUPU
MYRLQRIHKLVWSNEVPNRKLLLDTSSVSIENILKKEMELSKTCYENEP